MFSSYDPVPSVVSPLYSFLFSSLFFLWTFSYFLSLSSRSFYHFRHSLISHKFLPLSSSDFVPSAVSTVFLLPFLVNLFFLKFLSYPCVFFVIVPFLIYLHLCLLMFPSLSFHRVPSLGSLLAYFSWHIFMSLFPWLIPLNVFFVEVLIMFPRPLYDSLCWSSLHLSFRFFLFEFFFSFLIYRYVALVALCSTVVSSVCSCFTDIFL